MAKKVDCKFVKGTECDLKLNSNDTLRCGCKVHFANKECKDQIAIQEKK